jgi:hypothetical protein
MSVSTGSADAAVVRDCTGKRSGDCGYEVDSAMFAVIESCEAEDSWNSGILLRNFHAAQDVDAQLTLIKNCRTHVKTLDGANVNTRGYTLNPSSVQYGHIVIDGCIHHTAQTKMAATINGWALNAGSAAIKKLSIRDLTIVADAIAEATGGAAYFPRAAYILPASDCSITLKNIHTKIAGAVGTGFRNRMIAVGCDGSRTIDLDIDGLTFDSNLTGLTNSTTRLLELGVIAGADVCTLRGVVRRVKVAAYTAGDTQPRAVYVYGQTPMTIDGLLVMEDVDARKFPNTATDIDFDTTGGSNISKVDILRLRGSTFPTAGAAISVSASPFVYQNVNGRQVRVLSSGGETTLFEWSQDGVTYRDAGMPGGGVFVLDSGAYLRVTYNTAPTMRWEATK